MDWKQVAKRTDQAERAVASGKLPEDKSLKIKTYLGYQNYANYGVKFSTVGFVWLLHRKNFFKKYSPLFIKEFFLVGGLMGYMIGAEMVIGSWFWENVRTEVREYGYIKEKEFEDFSKRAASRNRTDKGTGGKGKDDGYLGE